jgi:type IV pilus assembly protein PilY1
MPILENYSTGKIARTTRRSGNMLNMHRIALVLGIVCFLGSAPNMIQADDTEIFGGGTIDLPPNVLIIFDNSGSMADTVQVPGWQPMGSYNPSTTYTGTYSSNLIYYQNGSNWSAFGSPQVTLSQIHDSYQTIVNACVGSSGSNTTNCNTAKTNAQTAYNNLTGTAGYFNGKIRTTSPYFCTITTSTSHGVTTTTISIPSSSYTIATGNYVNYYIQNQQNNNAEYDTKIHIAQKTICSLIDATSGVHWGLMTFNPSGTQDHGGVLVAPCQDWSSNTTTLKNKINALTAQTWTPLAETLAEAGLYFARKSSWSNTGSNYSSSYPTDYSTGTYTTTWDSSHPSIVPPAILWRCQKSYVIIMTDGDSTHDNGTGSSSYTVPNPSILTGTYMLGKTIGDYDNSNPSNPHQPSTESTYFFDNITSTWAAIPQGTSPSGSDYLDDVAKFLYDNDLMQGSSTLDANGISFDNSDFPKQNIITYTIGFGSGFTDFGESLLQRTADSNHGHAQYFTTSGTVSLQNIFNNIITSILTSNSQYVSPVVPVNRVNRTYADNGIYLGLFLPDATFPGLWKGNIKKFGFSVNGQVLDVNGNAATNSNGSIMDSSHYAWVSVSGNEGMQVDKGGFGAELLTQTSRTFKTFKSSASGSTLLDFNTTNVLPSDLGLSTTTQRDDLINFATASGVYVSNSGDAKARPWVLGDIIHSQPAVLPDTTNHRNLIFAGANDGFLHCLADNDVDNSSSTLTDDTVTELWSFIPWDLLPNLQYLPSTSSAYNVTGDTNHDYFVDGSPEVYTKSDKTHTYVAFGLRRGGKNIAADGELANQYTILDISNYNTTSFVPTFVTYIPKTILGTTSEPLGQSWPTPHFCKLRTGTDSSGKPVSHDVLLFTGGYDTNQDNADPGAADSKGRAIFAYDIPSSTGPDSNLNFNHSNYTKMKYCMVDLKSYDNDDDGCDDTIYTPSVGGDLFALSGRTNNGNWTIRRLFTATPSSTTPTTTSNLRKFFYAPGIAQENWSGTIGDWVYIGSGDRENPEDTTVTNRFYAIRNTWPGSWNDDSPITDTNLTDMSDDIFQNSSASQTDITNRKTALASSNGWYFNLENSGEKMVSTPLVFNKVAYFTTYSPTSSSSGSDKCSGGTGTGNGRLYAVDFETGTAVFPGFGSTGATSGTGDAVKADRSTSLGTGIPSQPILVVTQNGTFVVVGTSQGTGSYNTNDSRSLTRYYWLKQ